MLLVFDATARERPRPMLTQGGDVEVHALAGRGWSISTIARHLGRDRKTVRVYVNGRRSPGVRRRPGPDPLEPFTTYLAARLADDPHLCLMALFDEVVPLGYGLSYPSFVRGVRQHGLRPHCERSEGVRGRATIEIEHPPGDEIQWDWFERRHAPWPADQMGATTGWHDGGRGSGKADRPGPTVQGPSSGRAGEPPGQAEQPPAQGLGGDDARLETDAGRPARQVCAP
jgi:hypothetical protein